MQIKNRSLAEIKRGIQDLIDVYGESAVVTNRLETIEDLPLITDLEKRLKDVGNQCDDGCDWIQVGAGEHVTCRTCNTRYSFGVNMILRMDAISLWYLSWSPSKNTTTGYIARFLRKDIITDGRIDR